MEVLHAPWRIRYVIAPKPAADRGGESLFERLGRSSDDEGNLVVARSKHSFVALNAYPYNGGHLLVAPYRRVAEFDELTPDEAGDLMQSTQRAVRALRRTMAPHGFNIGLNLGRCAGAGIAEHLHMHVVPRWDGDTNFMPVLAGAHVLPEALAETAAKLRATFADLAAAGTQPDTRL